MMKHSSETALDHITHFTRWCRISDNPNSGAVIANQRATSSACAPHLIADRITYWYRWAFVRHLPVRR